MLSKLYGYAPMVLFPIVGRDLDDGKLRLASSIVWASTQACASFAKFAMRSWFAPAAAPDTHVASVDPLADIGAPFQMQEVAGSQSRYAAHEKMYLLPGPSEC